MHHEDAVRILLAENDLKLAVPIREYLETNGFEVGIESRGDRAGGNILAAGYRRIQNRYGVGPKYHR